MAESVNPNVSLYDTTLRDGTQREGLSLSGPDKLRIARRLDELGVAFIEGGWPLSNPKDVEFFERARDLEWKHSIVTAFGSTRRVGLHPEDDPGLRALLDARTAAVTVFGKSSPLHVTEVLGTTLDENLKMIEQSVAFLRAEKRRVIYDAEHFFDGYAIDPAYALETLHAAIRGGAEAVVLCDTNGGTLPWQITEVVSALRVLQHPIGIHTHNDGECAVANALAAVRAGAVHIQGTINGYGERCGNANLCAIAPNLELKLGRRCLPPGNLAQLSETAHFVAEVANLAADEHQAFVGRSAFAHKGGVHIAAMRKNPRSYQHIEPEAVGNISRIVVSELSGKATLLGKAEEYGVTLAQGAESRVLADIKQAEAAGLAFEAAEASVALMMKREDPAYAAPFHLIEYKVLVRQPKGQPNASEATVKLNVNGAEVHTVAEGNGPVSALDAALRKALLPVYPGLEKLLLVDYKVRILESRQGTSAITRVLIDSSDGARRWSTVGAAPSIIAASWQALADSFEYALTFPPEQKR
jgi:2-isopropylmalate synthase